MKKINYKGRCEKRKVSKCKDICRTYSKIQSAMVDGSTRVRECVWRNNLNKPSYAKLLDISRNYWLSHGIEDWGIVIEKEDHDEGQ